MISDIKMPLITDEGTTLLICFNEAEIQIPVDEDITVTKFSYDHVRVDLNATEPQIVSAIVRSRYEQDEAEAIMFNHMKADDPKKEKHEQEYNDFQAWRDKAKEIAKQVFEK